MLAGQNNPSKMENSSHKTTAERRKRPRQNGLLQAISLTSCQGKILEKIIADTLNHYLETRELLNSNQAGFQKGRSTTDQILKLTQSATDVIQSKDKTSTTA